MVQQQEVKNVFFSCLEQFTPTEAVARISRVNAQIKEEIDSLIKMNPFFHLLSYLKDK